MTQRQREQLLGVGGAQGERLLAEHVLAGLEGGGDVLEVQGVRRGDVHHVDGPSASSSSYEPYAAAKPCSCANAAARACERDPTAVSSASGTSPRSWEKERAMRPGPRTPQRVLMGAP